LSDVLRGNHLFFFLFDSIILARAKLHRLISTQENYIKQNKTKRKQARSQDDRNRRSRRQGKSIKKDYNTRSCNENVLSFIFVETYNLVVMISSTDIRKYISGSGLKMGRAGPVGAMAQ
jgi:hypothetical protein